MKKVKEEMITISNFGGIPMRISKSLYLKYGGEKTVDNQKKKGKKK